MFDVCHLMRVKAALLLMLCFTSAGAQTANDLEKQFGKPEGMYSVNEKILLYAQFAADGQVCRVSLYPVREPVAQSTMVLQYADVQEFLNSFLPLEKRGAKKWPFGQTATGGGAAWTTYTYERVTFTFSASNAIQRYNGELLRRGEFVFTLKDYVPPLELPSPSKDDFKPSESERIDTVGIHWNERKCLNE